MNFKTIAALAFLCFGFASQAQTTMPVRTGKIVDIQTVRTESPASPTGTALAGVLGASAGAYLAKDAGWQLQALAGAAGAAAGGIAAQRYGGQWREALQIIVALSDGQLQAVVQEPGETQLQVGQSVYLVGQGSTIRITPAGH